MSVVEDFRKLIQDLVTPQLQALQVTVAGLATEAKLDLVKASVANLEQSTNLKLANLEQNINLKFETMDAKLELLKATVAQNHATILHALDIDRRMERLEASAKQVQ